MIFKEAINNALKHSGCSMIELNAVIKEEAVLIITLTDNGTGIDDVGNKKGGGSGLQNMRQRTARINGTLQVSSNPLGAGTSIILTIIIPK